ncbi:AGE family epimerase/isomerase [Paenibacillus nasutitermitis]|uniref:Cellobiose 2-epimerase n=1 Tax=Paenibacillus nasutitermitis TaxID=1652958 RepID=A0A917E565_9BACL|nr:AGE family epimerase/isomerase [Paenibacillus nasutitermitis]GGE01990.1 cellobiose 2-epimerase [Paenibacillus nasutitermitis]
MLTLSQWSEELEREVRDNILGFWKRRAVDEERGGFIGRMESSGRIDPDADKGLVLNARILWTFASAYRIYGEDEDLRMAQRALRVLETTFLDQEHGGFYWMTTAHGEPAQDKKQVYGQAFVIYALAEYVWATGDREPLKLAEQIYRLLEKHAYDPVERGYVEALARDWSATDDMSLSGTDLNERKSMNTHLHILEAYTNLFRVWKPDGLRGKLQELIEVHLERIIDPANHHFLLFFNDEWESQSADISYGHDIEGSWLLCEAAEVLGNPELAERVKAEALAMAKAALEEGVDQDGGMFNELHENGHLDDTKDWWPQAEAMVGFLNAYQISGDAVYMEAAKSSWAFIASRMSDREGGEWHWRVSREGVPVSGHSKIDAWKCPYHNSRACFEVLERLKKLTE